MEIFSTLDSIQNFLLQFGIWTPLAFFLLQLLQIIVAPIPGGTIGLVGGALFGTIGGFLLSGSGTIIGSSIVFLLSKRFGRPFVLKFASVEVVEKYDHIKESKLNIILFLIFLFPLFPDDMLCFIAGLSAMPFKTFLIIAVLARSPSVFINTMVGAGIMDDTPTQFIVAVSIYAVFILILYLNRKRLDAFIRHSKKNKDELSDKETHHKEH
ncbi:TVP38/TMEM64 family protein [Acetobacterium fimetarium]|uniref:TVP38/TMEM64 family membrane protein n=1 Tax=Acetobacterium fimetarium TaxID=52691 RepID=A0ABR6WV70_9FIRM|nr:VTT domain-containing protein [Acetobacterium fimetarium]MBC3804398.1 TVP38/TMEM64 family protein [Acetobacterium fimetarium]